MAYFEPNEKANKSSKKVDFSQFSCEKPVLEWQNEYDYLPFLAKKINGVIRRLLRHNLDFEKVVDLIYENQNLYDLMADWQYEGWEITPQAYYRYYRDAIGLSPLDSEELFLPPYDKEHETFIIAVETARRKLGFTRADVFWGRYRKTLMEVFSCIDANGCSAKELEDYITTAIPAFGTTNL